MPAFCPLWSHGLWVRTGFESASQISVNWLGLCITLVVSLIRLTGLHSAFLDLQTYIPLSLTYKLTFRFPWLTDLHSAFLDLQTYIPLSLNYRLTFRFPWLTDLHSAFLDLQTYIPLFLNDADTFGAATSAAWPVVKGTRWTCVKKKPGPRQGAMLFC